ncbi:methionyl-tRNA synthetase domain protein [Mycobacterium xenopi 3993]|nr:methionyl-tRNA synthetase domain protein [Mycobacterium xenopi 3993]
MLAIADGLLEQVRTHFDAQAMHLALEAIWLMLGAANKYFSAQQPWVLRKSESESDQTRFRTVLYVTCEVLRIAALLIQPVLPESASKLLDLLGQPADQRTFAAVGTRLTQARSCRPRPRCSPLPTGVTTVASTVRATGGSDGIAGLHRRRKQRTGPLACHRLLPRSLLRQPRADGRRGAGQARVLRGGRRLGREQHPAPQLSPAADADGADH